MSTSLNTPATTCDRHRCDRGHRNTRRRAFTLVEAVISILIVGVMFVAVLNTVGAARVGQQKIGDRQQGSLLAQQLMEEILLHDYEAADGLAPPQSRADFDNLDDFAGWTASPPQHADGVSMSHLAGWERRVEVAWVEPDNLEFAAPTETGLKRITVTVHRNQQLLASLTAVRTSSRQSPLDALEIDR